MIERLKNAQPSTKLFLVSGVLAVLSILFFFCLLGYSGFLGLMLGGTLAICYLIGALALKAAGE